MALFLIQAGLVFMGCLRSKTKGLLLCVAACTRVKMMWPAIHSESFIHASSLTTTVDTTNPNAATTIDGARRPGAAFKLVSITSLSNWLSGTVVCAAGLYVPVGSYPWQ